MVLAGLRHDVPRLLAAMDVFVTASPLGGAAAHRPAGGGDRTAASSRPSADGVVDVVHGRATGLLVPLGDAEASRRA